MDLGLVARYLGDIVALGGFDIDTTGLVGLRLEVKYPGAEEPLEGVMPLPTTIFSPCLQNVSPSLLLGTYALICEPASWDQLKPLRLER